MPVRISLRNNYGYEWEHYNGVYSKGYASLDGELLNGKKLSKVFYDVQNYKELKNLLKRLHGIFSVILQFDDSIYLATDITRTFPIFYTVSGNEAIVSDDTFYIQEIINSERDKDACVEFLRTLYVTGDETLIQGIEQVQAGEIVRIGDNGTVAKEFYHEYTVEENELLNLPSEDISSKIVRAFDNTIERLIEFAQGDTIVVPLSGGYDSRAIVAFLKKHGYENVICYTYGREDSTEVNTAKDVARKLGYEWIYVNQKDDIVDPGYPNEQWFLEFYKYAFNHVSTIHLQDFFVFKYLHENGLIPKHSIVVPGHTGDFLRGSHLRKLSLPKTKEDVWKRVLALHFVLNEHVPLTEKVIQKFWSYMNRYPPEVFVYSIEENWNMKNRQAKFIINSNRTYEFFGYRHAIPLWDIELVELFRRMPLRYKYEKVMYNVVLENIVFKPLGILIRQADKASDFRSRFYHRVFHSWEIFKSLRYWSELYLPYQLKRPLRDLVWKDENNFYAVVRPLLSELGRKYYFSEAHGLVAEWCLKRARCEEVVL
ncbi:asparagine synthase C-terminal domain-containing protein [Thermococcus zilligii]|uniref:asparagine synthase C-terminal domain-containing protein n=1 Tax=Thermococcus zilligii TaxID=54076 RepID=UPI00029B0037|nr:asparagine synthase C-terminal domain-containing protein [Thermococcus zilligii]